MEREDALVELARRYVHAYGPAAPADLAAWSGLTLSDARVGFRGLSGQLAEVQMGSEPAWMLLSQAAWIGAAPPAEPVVRMLAEWDGYLLGYRNRDLALGPTFAERVHAGAGMIRPTLLVDGRVCGRWRRQRTSAGLTAALEAFEPLSTDVRTEIEAEIRDMARFLEIDVTLGRLAGG